MSVYEVNNSCDTPQILNNSSVCFGVFDGIHEGHLFELNECICDARKNNTNSVCITFDIDPDEIFVKDFKKLMTNNQRLNQLEQSGINDLIIINFENIKDIEAIDFLNMFFLKHTPKSIHVGDNFQFGKNALGTTDILQSWGKKNNVDVHIHELLKKDGKVISSTMLREILN